jgi:hypothetical protein
VPALADKTTSGIGPAAAHTSHSRAQCSCVRAAAQCSASRELTLLLSLPRSTHRCSTSVIRTTLPPPSLHTSRGVAYSAIAAELVSLMRNTTTPTLPSCWWGGASGVVSFRASILLTSAVGSRFACRELPLRVCIHRWSASRAGSCGRSTNLGLSNRDVYAPPPDSSYTKQGACEPGGMGE